MVSLALDRIEFKNTLNVACDVATDHGRQAYQYPQGIGYTIRFRRPTDARDSEGKARVLTTVEACYAAKLYWRQ